MYPAADDGLAQLAGVAQTAGHRHADLTAGDGEDRFVPAVMDAAHLLEMVYRGISAGEQEISRPQGGLHNAAGGAEDDGRAGSGAQGRIKVFFGQGGGVDVGGADHAVHLAGGEHHIHVPAGARVIDSRHSALIFLGGAGHHGDDPELGGVGADLLGKIGFGYRTEHLLGRFGRAELGDQLGEFQLQKPHPAGAAGGKHGPLIGIGVFQTLQKLAAFLHNGQVCGKIGVKHIVHTQCAEGGGHALFGGLLLGKAQAFAPGGAHRRRDLHDGDNVRIGNVPEHLLGVIPLPQGAHGAVGDALSAQGAPGILDAEAVPNAHGGAGAYALHIPDAHVLDLFTGADAAHALDALGIFTNQGIALVPLDVPRLFFIGEREDVHVVGQPLQSTVAAADAGGAVTVVLGQDQLHVDLAGLAGTLAVGVDHHALFHIGVAGGAQAVTALHLHHADPASADLVQVLEIAQGGNVDAQTVGSLQNGPFFWNGDFFLVDGQGYHFFVLPPLNAPKP